MKSFSIMLAGLSLFAVSCERHDFEGPDGTKQLHEHHGAAHQEHAESETPHEAHPEKAAH
jgi:hypothetical protein